MCFSQLHERLESIFFEIFLHPLKEEKNSKKNVN